MNADKPMERKANALADLAEDLGNIDDGPSPESICKAKRIVAELAKVKFFASGNGAKYANLAESADALEKSLAIAEEGVNNGRK